MAIASAAELAARLDRLPMTRHIWVLVTLISLGGCFELYDLFLTAYIAPGLLKAGYFTPELLGPFSVLAPYGVAGIGTFVFALFAGLFVGAIFLGHFADSYGRRTVFTFSLIWYSITTAIMAFQTSGFAVDLWRFIAGIGIGIELVTIDTYVSELVPRSHRGRAYAYNQFFQFSGGAAGCLPRLAARAAHAPRPGRLALGRADRLGRRDRHLVHSPVTAGIAALAGTARTHGASRAGRRRDRKPGYK